MRLETAEVASGAFGRWRGILESAGVDPKFLQDRKGPCPWCGGKDRFRFDDKGNGMFFCQQCGAGDGFEFLKRMGKGTFYEIKKFVAAQSVIVSSVPPTPRDSESKRIYMREVFKGSCPIVPGDPVWSYLTRRCGDLDGLKLDDIRYHPNLKHSEGGFHPAMVAVMRRDGKAIGIHRTYLTLDGRKAEVVPVKSSFGECGLLTLGDVQDRCGIAEGIETAICASRLFGIPCISGISAHGLETFQPPQGVKEIWIFGDCDESFTGQAAAYTLAKRIIREGFKVQVRIPDQFGQDWADVAEMAVVA